MRLFVAVPIDGRVKRLAGEIQAELQGLLAPVFTTRWLPPDNMHLTVRFIGHVDDARAPALVAMLTRPLDVPPFEIELGACGVFPPNGPPRVIWIGLAHGLTSLALLQNAFNQRLSAFGIDPEVRPFRAHLTLGRIKDAPRGSGGAVREALRGMAVPALRFQVSRATVFRSHLSPKGSRYEPMGFSPLNADP
jgi:2'-5' RNA ligase